MKLSLLVAVVMGITASGSAALPPLHQSIKELKAILDDPELSKELTSGEVIEAIERTESGYEVYTNRSSLQVDVHYQSQATPGPIPFDLQFHKAEE